jgi:hypothetical protein
MTPQQKVVQGLTLAKVHQWVTANHHSGDAEYYIYGSCLLMYTMTGTKSGEMRPRKDLRKVR